MERERERERERKRETNQFPIHYALVIGGKTVINRFHGP